MHQANNLIDKKLLAMKRCTEKEVEGVYRKMREVIDKFSLKQPSEETENPEKSKADIMREVNRKL